MKSLGFIEISGVAAAIDALDLMCKAADVELVTWERKMGGRLVTLKQLARMKKQCASSTLALKDLRNKEFYDGRKEENDR